MSRSENLGPDNGTQAKFPAQTQWTLVVQPAADPSTPAAREALNQLCQAYWFPVYAFIRSQRIDSHQAKDLTQGFFVHLLEGNLIQQARRDKGRFRTFLLACLRNFMNDQRRHDLAIKRGGGASVYSIDDEAAEDRYRKLPAVQPAPEVTFDQTWAEAVIELAIGKLMASYAARGRLDVFEAMKGCLTGELAPEDYAGMSARLGMSRGTFEVNLSRFRQSFGACARGVISQTVEPSEINAEIKYLMAAWAALLNEKQ